MKFSMKTFFSKCVQIRRKLQSCSHLLKISSMKNFISCAVTSFNLRCLTEFSMHLWYGFSQLKSTKILRVLRTKQITIVFDYFRIKFEVLESILIPPPPPSPERVDKKIIKNDTGWRGTAKKVMGLTQSFSVLIFLATDFALLYLMKLWSEADLGLLQHPRWRSLW